MSFFRKVSEKQPDYFKQLPTQIELMVSQALEEDINLNANGTDITAELIPEDRVIEAEVISRSVGVLSGQDWFDASLIRLDETVHINWHIQDGEALTRDSVICSIRGNARAILSAERSALNFLQTLSGTATVTSQYQSKIAHTTCRLLDTRKTIPGFRLAQKYAVYCGGGHNHRVGLYDAYLIKENHIRACGGIDQAVSNARVNYPDKMVEIEVESLDELQQAIEARADIVMLDNFTNTQKAEAVILNAGRVKLEASGDITLATIAAVAETGVDFISVGAITKHLDASDFSLLVKQN